MLTLIVIVPMYMDNIDLSITATLSESFDYKRKNNTLLGFCENLWNAIIASISNYTNLLNSTIF